MSSGDASDRKQRLAEALRANLRKRKAQARERMTAAPAPEAGAAAQPPEQRREAPERRD
ncbi:hypothetical protein ACFFJB_04205 [Camelimonas abortus]|uniref:Uncharacterized protein n=1 Tax=Camelimonas abortus TaxID=1017184 RepID=A0ABV7LDR2_9HYPH